MGKSDSGSKRPAKRRANPLAPAKETDKAAQNGTGTGTGSGPSAGSDNASTAPSEPGAKNKPAISLGITADKPKSKPPARAVKAEADQSNRAKESAQAFVVMAETGAVAIVGEEAAMTKLEKAGIEGPLTRILSRVESETLETVNTWTDPVALSIALFGWANRVIAIQMSKNAAAEAARIAEQEKFGLSPMPEPEQPPNAAPPAPTFGDLIPDPYAGSAFGRGMNL